MNFTLYSVKSNDLPPMKVPLWILEGALRVQESPEEWLLHPWVMGVVERGAEEEIKGGSALWRIVMASYYSYVIRDCFTEAPGIFPWRCTLGIVGLIGTRHSSLPQKKHVHTHVPAHTLARARNRSNCISAYKSRSAWRPCLSCLFLSRFIMPPPVPKATYMALHMRGRRGWEAQASYQVRGWKWQFTPWLFTVLSLVHS